MKFARIGLLVWLTVAVAAETAGAEVFDLSVKRVRTLRNEAGTLHIDDREITFRSSDARTTIMILMQDLREADVADRGALRFQTYGVQKWKPIERQSYTFQAAPDAPVEELARFLAARTPRPVVGHFPQTAEFHVAAYHRRKLGGSGGTLSIGPESIAFASDRPADSRTWLYRDVETIGRPDRFRFRVTTSRESYVLELKAELPEAAYQQAWNTIYDFGGGR